MKRKFEVIATVGKYTDQTTGKKVKRTLPVGAIYESDGGKLVLRLDALPIASEFSGWMQVKPCTPDLPPGRRLPPGMPPAPPPDESDDDEPEIPF